MAAGPRYVIPYRAFPLGHRPRPYVDVSIKGIDLPERVIPGMLDTGADTTTLPFGVTSLPGYKPDDLEAERFRHADGEAVAMVVSSESRT